MDTLILSNWPNPDMIIVLIRLDDQQMLRLAYSSVQPRKRLHVLHTHRIEVDEGIDPKPGHFPLQDICAYKFKDDSTL